MATYNGHPSYNAWNISLWIHNDQGLYAMAREDIRTTATRDEAAQRMLESLQLMGVTHTPDGAPYTATNIRRAMRSL